MIKKRRVVSFLVIMCFISNIFMPFTAFAEGELLSTSKKTQAAAALTTDIPVTGIEFDNLAVQMHVGDEATLVATVIPADATNKNLIWSTDSSNVIELVNGRVRAIDKGNAKVTVTTEDGGKTADRNVIVHEYYNNTLAAPTFGATPTEATKGNVTVTITYPTDARCSDRAGNTSANVQYAVTNIDNDAPYAPTIVPSTTAPTSGNVLINIQYQDDAIMAEFRVDDGEWTEFTEPFTITQNSTVYARCKDDAGNISEETSYIVTNIDKMVPNAPRIIPSTTSPTNGNVVITISYEDDAIMAEFRVDDGEWREFIEPFTITKNSTIYARCRNAEGNVSQQASYEITNIVGVALAKPIIEPNIKTATYDSVTMTVYYPEGATIRQYRVTDGQWTNYTQPFSVSKNLIVYARCYDALGNQSADATYEVTNILIYHSHHSSSSSIPASPILTEIVTSIIQDQINKVQATIGADNNGNASISKALIDAILNEIDRLKAKGINDITLLLNIDGNNSDICRLIIPDVLVKELNKRGITNIEVLTNISQINLTVKSLLKDNTLDYLLEIRKYTNPQLSTAEQNALGNARLFGYSLFEDIKLINKRTTILMPYDLKPGENPNYLTVFALSDSEKTTNLGGRYLASQGGIEFITNGSTKFFAKTVNVQFNDLDGFNWAKESINSLYAKGIIGGIGNGKYGPQLKLTRAQFTTMLVNLLKLTDNDSQMQFIDVLKGIWYYDKLAAASQNEIIKGKSVTIFAPNEYATRQDIALIVSRVLKMQGIVSPNTTVSIKDFAKIYDYAKGGVIETVKTGIMKGDPDGNFRPLNSITRAEAAVIIYNLLNK